MEGSDSKTLAEMGVVLEGSGWPEGDAVAKEVLARCHASDAVTVIDELIARVHGMAIASRLSTTKAPNWETGIFVGASRGVPNPEMRQCPSEAEAKRAQLLLNLRTVKSKLEAVFGSLSSIVLDIEATGKEFIFETDAE